MTAHLVRNANRFTLKGESLRKAAADGGCTVGVALGQQIVIHLASENPRNLRFRLLLRQRRPLAQRSAERVGWQTLPLRHQRS